MTTLHYIKKARKNIYQQGKSVTLKHTKGKHAGQQYTKTDRTQPANKSDKIYIKKGEPYYWYQFAFRSITICKERPPRSRYATQSEHLGAIYDLEDQLSAMTTADIQEGCLDEILSEIDNIIDTCQERLDNMPEQLQQAPSGEKLQEYIDNCESWKSDLEAVDLEIDEDELRSEAQAEYEEALSNCKPATEEDPAEEPDQDADDLFDIKLEDAKQSILDNIQGCTYPG